MMLKEAKDSFYWTPDTDILECWHVWIMNTINLSWLKNIILAYWQTGILTNFHIDPHAYGHTGFLTYWHIYIQTYLHTDIFAPQYTYIPNNLITMYILSCLQIDIHISICCTLTNSHVYTFILTNWYTYWDA